MSFTETRQKFFPFSPAAGISIRPIAAAEAYPIIQPLVKDVFSPLADLGLMQPAQAPQLLSDSLQRHNENFIFYDSDDQPIGWSFGWQTEPDTFYMNWTGIIPAYQNQGIYSAFLRHFISYLKTLGYRRITSNHMVNNRRVIVAKMKAGFIASGMSLDERWGAVLWLTYFIDPASEAGFRSAFSLEQYDN